MTKDIQRLNSAWKAHSDVPARLVGSLQPKAICELGVFTGYSFFLFAEAVKGQGLDTTLIGVDNFEGDIHVGEAKYEEQVKAFAKKHYPDQDIRIVKGDIQEVSGTVRHKLDILHIDATHTYESVKKDFETYIDKLRDTGIVLLHDTRVNRPNFGVINFFKELSENDEYVTYEDTRQHGLGFVAFKNDTYKTSADIAKLLN